MRLIHIMLLFLCASLRFYYRENLKINYDQLITIVQPNIKQQHKWSLIKRENHIQKLVELSKYTVTSFGMKRVMLISSSFQRFLNADK